MSVFLDTSAILAFLDSGDENHARAEKLWKEVLAGPEPIFTTNYVLLESFSLIQHRLGLKAAHSFDANVLPVLTVQWVGEAEHRAGVASVLAAGRRRLSLVDCVSFLVMNIMGIRRCLSFDPHFREQGFEPLS